VAWARVSYLSGPTVYLASGSRDGLRTGTHLRVMRDTQFVAELAVQYISSSSAACTVVRTGGPNVTVAVGDSAQFMRAVPEPVAAPVVRLPGTDDAPQAVHQSVNPLRGRIGVRYLSTDAGIGPAGVMTQPAFDLRLDGSHVGGSALGVAVDVRAQRSILAPPDSTHPAPLYPLNLTRVYKAAAIWNPPGGRSTLTLGRQFSSTSSSVGLFDGLSMDYVHPHWSVGAFGGWQPSYYTYAFSDSTREYGAYMQWHNVAARFPVWSFTVGGVGAYTMGQIDREFAYATAMVAASRLSVYVTQELDVNRGWRAAQEHASTTPTSTFATVQLALTDMLSLNGGMDNRRNVRLYRDYVSPEAVFDDSFRQGAWGGASLNVRGMFRLSGDARTTSGGTTGAAQSYTGSAAVMRLTPLQFGVRVRETRYSGQLSSGDLQSASLELNPFNIVHFEATAGLRTSVPTASAIALGPSRMNWNSVDADFSLGRSVYAVFSIYRERGAGLFSAQNFLSLSYRF
jgi:hypothetical protein